MIVDTSALLAIVFRERGWDSVLDRILASPDVAAGTPTLAETDIVLQARWREAADAFRRFGKGRHAAELDFGDCMTYAVARLAGEPLLHVGEDFGRTDISLA